MLSSCPIVENLAALPAKVIEREKQLNFNNVERVKAKKSSDQDLICQYVLCSYFINFNAKCCFKNLGNIFPLSLWVAVNMKLLNK